MIYSVRYAPEAQAQLDALEDYISQSGSPDVAARYVDAIVAYCDRLATFPKRGIQRDDLIPGLHITNYRGNTAIAFVVNTESGMVSILGVFYGGQDYETALQEPAGY